VDGVNDFAAAVEIALSAQTDADRKRRADLASRNTWDSRAERLLDLVAQELGR
jgi:hypothetical protein